MAQKQGSIYKILADTFYIRSDNEEIEARARGRFRKDKITPLVGDKVLLIPPKRDGEYYLIDEILPRINELLRPPVANIEKLVIVIAPVLPNPDLVLTDMLIAYCKYLNIKPIICINKCELDNAEADRLYMQFTDSGITSVRTSAKTDVGFHELKNELQHCITCFAGQSAVGKSSIINRLLQSKELKTGGLSKKTERGRHTTRHCEILYLPDGGQVIDTPGFSLLEHIKMTPEDFTDLYSEYTALSGTCRFRMCSHTDEPGCAVKSAVQNGQLPKDRYDRYVEIYKTIKTNWRNRYD